LIRPSLALAACAIVAACAYDFDHFLAATADAAAGDSGAPGDDDGGTFTDAEAPPAEGGADGGESGSDSALPAADGGACAALSIQAGAMVDGTPSDLFAWSDADCRPRAVPLFRNDAADALGGKGGYARSLTYQTDDGATRSCRGSEAWHGFGYVLSICANNTGIDSRDGTGGYHTVLAGKHHAIHQFSWLRAPQGGTVTITVQWFFATGRSHPVYAITYDTSAAAKDAVGCDARSPNGDLLFDNGEGLVVDGLGWGDKYRFVTTSGPTKVANGYGFSWDYSKPNIVPHVLEWSDVANAEMGLVQTQSWDDKEAGGDYGGGIPGLWGKTGTSLPTDWWWPYQLTQYDLPYTDRSHRMAWGDSFGAVGHAQAQAFGKTYSGYPYFSYSVYVVLGKHSPSAVDAQLAEMEAVQHTALTATRGTVATSGPRLAGSDTVPFTPIGFDPVYGAWTVDAASDAATLRIDAGSATLQNPVIVLRGYGAAGPPRSVTRDGRDLAFDRDFFATVDPAAKRLWLTLNARVTGSTVLTIN
jgi:hypothetical protein